MPRLLLLRHAKAEPAAAGQKDHERPLSTRGHEDSVTIGRMLAKHGECPDRVLCSTSVRTRETWEYVHPALKETSEVRFLREIFEADGDYISILRDNGGRSASLMVVGHNPAIHVTALRLAERIAGRDGGVLMNRFPTAAIAIFDFDGKWKDLRPGSMTLAAFICPRGPESD